MHVSPRINDFRRSLMHRLTRNVGKSNIDNRFVTPKQSEIKKILICRPNHRLGNLLLVTPLLEEVAATFPESRIDLFVKGNAAHDIFRNYDIIDRIISLPRKPFNQPLAYLGGWLQLKLRQYDMVINVDKKSASGRLSTKWASARYRFFGEENSNPIADARHIAKSPIYNFRAGLKKIGIDEYNGNVPQLNLKLSDEEIAIGQKILAKLTGDNRKTISLFTYATGNKCYSEDWWKKFYEKLKCRYSDYKIIEILPVENISKIAFKAPVFYSRNIREIGALIANTKVFIGADSGIMHLASAAGTPTIGLFSVTDETKYKPYNPKSLAINTSKASLKSCFKALNEILLQNGIGAA
jgi:ADP-heptose:LPS heptosyltransferase